MEGLVGMSKLREFYDGKRVFLTGHTGFKGAWLAAWLTDMGADVLGFALDPPSEPSLYELAKVGDLVDEVRDDILNFDQLFESMMDFRPEFVFHFAAQSIVRESYEDPKRTFDVNLMGTVNVLEALRRMSAPSTGVMVTSDKCYENQEWSYGYRETDRLGGWDPYSASKATAELAIDSYRRSFLAAGGVRMASARAGNVIGGGDYAKDRIVPDVVRAIAAKQPIDVRSPHAIRPWQHVLEALNGYLQLAMELSNADEAWQAKLAGPMNFGPPEEATRTVQQLVEELLKHWSGQWQDLSDPDAPHEAHLLRLVSDKAKSLLGWQGAWDFATTAKETIQWYQAVEGGADAREATLAQVRRFEDSATHIRR